MQIVMSGGTGFLGRRLADRLAGDGHRITILSRSADDGTAGPSQSIRRVRWDPHEATAGWIAALRGTDAVINLAGESIAARRWTTTQKARIRESRLVATAALVGAMRHLETPPKVFISSSATGYYGSRGSETLTERSARGSDFLASVCVEWEAEANKAADFTRVVLVRSGVVLASDGGALPKMLPPFKAFAGGPVGSGAQFMSWIHRKDWVDLVSWALATSAVTGPMNATAPEPVTNRVFSSALARALGRPSWLPAPGFALRLVLGEMADALLLSSQRVVPARAIDLGFRFSYPTLDGALTEIFHR